MGNHEHSRIAWSRSISEPALLIHRWNVGSVGYLVCTVCGYRRNRIGWEGSLFLWLLTGIAVGNLSLQPPALAFPGVKPSSYIAWQGSPLLQLTLGKAEGRLHMLQVFISHHASLLCKSCSNNLESLKAQCFKENNFSKCQKLKKIYRNKPGLLQSSYICKA